MKIMTAKEITAAVLAKYSSAEKVRIERGEVHAYGRMPNTNQDGWWFVAWREDVENKGINAL